MKDIVLFLKNGNRLRQQLIILMLTSIVFFVFSVYSLLVDEFSILAFFFIPITIFFSILSFSRYSQSFNTLAIYGSSFEIASRKDHEIIAFEDVISVKLQYREELPGFMVFHPIDLISSIFNWAQGKETHPHTQIDYEIETDSGKIYNYFIEVGYELLLSFIERIYQESGMKPIMQEFQSIDYVGKIFYFSFRDLHTELDPDSVRELL